MGAAHFLPTFPPAGRPPTFVRLPREWWPAAWGNKFVWGYDESMDDELQRVFDVHCDAGCGLFDTGDSYGTGALEGRSETLLGEFGEARRARSAGGSDPGPIFATKLATYPWRLSRRDFTRACRSSLDRMQTRQIGLAQAHWSAQKYAPWQERAIWDGLGDMAEEGLARAIGVSNYGPRQLCKIHAHLASRGIQLGTCQVQMSLLSWGPLQRDTLAACADLGVQVIAYSPFALGLLSGSYAVPPRGSGDARVPPGFRGFLFRDTLPAIAPLLEEMRRVGEDVGATAAQIALGWCLAKGAVPIPGAKSAAQARANVAALALPLSSEHCRCLEAAAAKCSKQAVQNIFMTS